MFRCSFQKALILIIAVSISLLAPAGPAGADVDVVGGVLRLGSPTVFEIELGGDPDIPAPCVPTINPPVGPFSLEFDGDDETGAWETDGGFAVVFDLLGSWYKAVYDFSYLAGTYQNHENPPPIGLPYPHWDIGGGGELYVDIYQVFVDKQLGPEQECGKDDVPVCVVWVPALTIVPHSYHVGSSSPPVAPGPGDYFVISAASDPPHIVSGHCLFPFNLLDGWPAFVDDMVLEL